MTNLWKDIFERVGRGTAYDEYIEFEVKDGKIHYEGDESEITGGKIRVEFIKVMTKFLCNIDSTVLSFVLKIPELPWQSQSECYSFSKRSVRRWEQRVIDISWEFFSLNDSFFAHHMGILNLLIVYDFPTFSNWLIF